MKMSAWAPEVYIDPVAMAEIRSWAYEAEGEVSGLGLVEVSAEEGRIVSLEITEVFLLAQECTKTSTELDPDAVARLLVDLEREGRSSELRLWWHSHADMGVFWSPTDERNITGLCPQDFMLSLVVNKAWETLVRVDWFAPARVTLDDLPLRILLPDADVADRCRRQVAELVRAPVPPRVVVRRWSPPAPRRPDQELFEDSFGFWDHTDRAPFLVEEE
jgi:hypothetical protein